MPMKDDQVWTEYMLDHPLKTHKAKITINDLTTVFEVRISVLKVNQETRYVVIFNDISEMQFQTMIDQLTKIPNRFHFTMVYEHTIRMSQRSNTDLSVIFFDIDHFKDVNDTYEHLVGDIILQKVSELVSQKIRRSDFIARWGGEEFVILLPNTDLGEAVHVAEMIRVAINDHFFQEVGHLTCSFGVVSLQAFEEGSHLLNRADELMYEAKKGGRNKVVY
jgi:diguanylate cyclase (GGDEF)-like protein